MPKIYDTRAKAWEQAEAWGHDGEGWVEIAESTRINGETYRSPLSRGAYLGEGTVLQRDITDMPLDPRTDELAATTAALTPFGPAGGWGARTSLNTSAFGTQPIHAYLVDSSEPHGTRTFRGSVSIGVGNIPGENAAYLDGGIPIEEWMVPAQNGDRGMAVYDLGTGIMREWFMVKSVSTSEPDVWTGGGGYSLNNPGLKDLAKTNYGLQQRRGLSNVAGMHNSLGFVGIEEVLLQKINHALCVTAATSYMYKAENGGEPLVSWPARGADGKLENYLPGGSKYAQGQKWDGSTVTPVHGQWGRLKASVDPMYNPKTGKPYPLLCRILIEAAKKYGLVFTDTNLWCHAFNAEQGRTWAHFYGEDPWKYQGLVWRSLMDRYGVSGWSTDEFPWDQTEWAPVDWGRPSPDWNMRPGDVQPWIRKEA